MQWLAILIHLQAPVGNFNISLSHQRLTGTICLHFSNLVKIQTVFFFPQRPCGEGTYYVITMSRFNFQLGNFFAYHSHISCLSLLQTIKYKHKCPKLPLLLHSHWHIKCQFHAIIKRNNPTLTAWFKKYTGKGIYHCYCDLCYSPHSNYKIHTVNWYLTPCFPLV